MPVNNRGIYEYAETDLDSTASDMLNRQSAALSAKPAWIALPLTGVTTGYAEYCIMAGRVHFRARTDDPIAADTRVEICVIPAAICDRTRPPVLAAAGRIGRPATSYVGSGTGIVYFRNSFTASSDNNNLITGVWPLP